MKNKKSKIIIGILVIVIILLSIRVIFDSKFDDFSNFIRTRENYEGGVDKFDKDFEGLAQWEKDYKEKHPEATQEEIDEAFKKAWGK